MTHLQHDSMIIKVSVLILRIQYPHSTRALSPEEGLHAQLIKLEKRDTI